MIRVCAPFRAGHVTQPSKAEHIRMGLEDKANAFAGRRPGGTSRRRAAAQLHTALVMPSRC
jgi:hypothetical protein